MNQPNEHLYLFATIRPKLEFFEQAKDALNDLVPLTLEEPGCHLFSVFTGQGQEPTLHLMECFDDENALQQHYDRVYTKAVFEKYTSWLLVPVEVHKLCAASTASSDQFNR